MTIWAMAAVVLVGMITAATASAQGLSVDSTDKGRSLRYEGRPLLELSSPWIATADFKALYRFPGGATGSDPAVLKTDRSPYGQWTESITRKEDSITIRYEFDLPADPNAAHVQWVWRLEPAAWNGIMAHGAGGQPERPVALHPLEGLAVTNLRQMSFILPDLDLAVTCRASDGEWSFRDARAFDWARAYRLEYNRPTVVNGKRTGWIEATITANKAQSPLVPLTAGSPVKAQGIEFQAGALRDSINATLGNLVFLHTVSGNIPRGGGRGQTAGEITVLYADGAKETVSLRSEEAFTSPTDDPRSVGNGRLAILPDKTPAWVSQWKNPRPEVAIQRLEARSLAGGWKLLAASGTQASADPRRVTALLRGDGQPLAEETAMSLDGTWQFSAEGVPPRDIPVPAFWDHQQGLANVHEGIYRRNFDIPASFAARRVALHFDAVGDAAEVWVNGRMAGKAISPALPFEVDITGLVAIPSTDNKLEVRVQDDSHFSIPFSGARFGSAKSWIPRGMGSNNRKGLYQSVSMIARPAVQISDVRIQTSVRNHEMLVTYTVKNTSRATVKAQVAASVYPADGGAAVLTLPATNVELPGYVATQVTVKAPFSGVELWQPNHPTLYSLRSLLMDGGKRVERVDTRFGFREVWFEGRSFYLNGIRCNLRGESPAYSEKAEMMATREAAAEMLRRYQQVNFNVLRFHSMPAPPHVLDLCDEMGMLVIDESAIYVSWGLLLPEHPDFMDYCRQHLTRWVQRDRNHPAVVLWSAENEGLNVNGLSPAQLAEFRKIIDAADGTRPVTYDGDGTAMGASPASNKHYVSAISDLKNRDGTSSGYGRDLRSDIYWATQYQQDIPLGCGEFLFPYEPGIREKEREVAYMMGLQTRGYRLADWYDIRPYNPSYTGFLTKEGVRKGYEEAYAIIVKSFAPVAVFDKAYDALGPFPAAPTLPAGQIAQRELIIYNDTFENESVEIEWTVRQGDRKVAGEKLTRTIPLGGHITLPIQFTPATAGALQLDLISRKAGKETFRDTRAFVVE